MYLYSKHQTTTKGKMIKLLKKLTFGVLDVF